MIESKLLEKGFALNEFSIKVEQDDNHTASLVVTILPSSLMTNEEKDTLIKFYEIMESQ